MLLIGLNSPIQNKREAIRSPKGTNNQINTDLKQSTFHHPNHSINQVKHCLSENNYSL